MNKKILFFLCLFITLFHSYSQQQFNYNFHIDETVREGTLFYNVNENTAVYLDKISSMKTVANKNDVNDVDDDTSSVGVSFNGNLDFYFLKDKSEVLFTYNLLKNNYLVEDKLPKTDWVLTSEKRVIEDLICYKATTTFRGRNWTAWYSPDIPIMYGPWKFYGLPGIIVEIKEDTNRFAFVLTGYSLNSKSIVPKINPKDFKKVSMKKMAEITDEAYDNLLNTLSNSDSGEVKVVLVEEKSKTEDDHGIEAIYEWEEQEK